MKMSFGRKFWAMVIALLLMTGILLIGMLAVNPTPVDGSVLFIYCIMVVTVTFMYVGGNVWNAWIKSKYFHSELAVKNESKI